jgi:hypothetical protein
MFNALLLVVTGTIGSLLAVLSIAINAVFAAARQRRAEAAGQEVEAAAASRTRASD